MNDDAAGRPASAGVWTVLALILVGSFALKLGLRLDANRKEDFWRSGYTVYREMADNLRTTGTLSWTSEEGSTKYAFRPPLYPLLIAGVQQFAGGSATAFAVLQAAFSTLIPLAVFGMARLANPDGASAPALWAAALAGFLPYGLYHDTALQETALSNACLTVAAFFAMASLTKHSEKLAVAAGLCAGLACLTRMSLLALAVCLAAAVALIVARRYGLRSACLWGLAFVVGWAAPTLPWVLRNRAVVGRLALTSETGYALARGNNPFVFDYYPYRASIDVAWGAMIDSLTPAESAELAALRSDEFAASEWFRSRAVAYMTADPWRTMRGGLIKTSVNFSGVLSPAGSTSKNALYSVSQWALTSLAVVGCMRLRRSEFGLVALAAIAAQCAVSFVFWAHSSHRTVLDPWLAVFAGYGVARLFARRIRERTANAVN